MSKKILNRFAQNATVFIPFFTYTEYRAGVEGTNYIYSKAGY